MSSELMDALKELAREKNIDETDMLERLEDQLALTYKRILDTENDCSVKIDRDTGRIYVYELVPVGGTEENPIVEPKDVTPSDNSAGVCSPPLREGCGSKARRPDGSRN